MDILSFLDKHGMTAERIDPPKEAARMAEAMETGLREEGRGLPMIPTYLRTDGNVPLGEKAIVIDAGGTNFRCALVTFTENGPETSRMFKTKMPGIARPASWDEFVSFVADAVEPLAGEADDIGFCFSYSAVITPEIDGRVNCIDKEVVIEQSEGKLVGASLLRELERRGITGKRIVILNDTAAVLLGVSATLDKEKYGGFIGQINGTGTNTCCIVPLDKIGKLHMSGKDGVIVNIESGLYDALPRGDFDLELDRESNNPGLKHLEKMTSGVYLGALSRKIFAAAAAEGVLSKDCLDRIAALGAYDASAVDRWASGGARDELGVSEDEAQFLQDVCLALFDRSARCMCTNLTAIALLTGEGGEKPICVCAEGSLVQKSRHFLPLLEKYLAEYALGVFGRKLELTVGYETTLPGAAAAVLLNK
jgi:hexokinase